MPLMPNTFPAAASETAFGSLALRAATLFVQPANASPDQTALQNLYRLLEMYRFDAFSSVTPRGVLDVRGPARQFGQGIPDPGAIRKALDSAKQTAFPDETKEAAVDILEGVVRDFAQNSVSEQQARERAKTFFEALAQNLRRRTMAS